MHHTPSESEKRFSPRGTRWCNTVLFDTGTAVSVIRECKQDRIPILGIEGFTLGRKDAKEVIYSDTADMLDLSGSGSEGYERSLAFVSNSRRGGMYFEFVFGD